MTISIPHLTFVHEDDDILVINKPPGLVVNKTDTTQEVTVQDWLESLQTKWQPWPTAWENQIPSDFDSTFGTPEEIYQQRQGIVHRLDKDTSGVMVIAKHPGSLVNLLHQFKTRQTHKQYLALVHGKVQAPEATLSFPIGRASQDRKQFAVQPEGREAVTTYEVQELFTSLDAERVAALIKSAPHLSQHPLASLTHHQIAKRLSIYQGFSLLRCWPKTGRTHQIRVHLAHIRHPLVGDVTYVGNKRRQLDPAWCPRHFLHAEKLTLNHPRTNESETYSAELSEDLKQSLSFLHNS